MVPHRLSRTRTLRAEPLEDRRMLAVAEFALADLNPTSSTDTFLKEVSPSDYAGQVSGWYFGHST